LRNTHIKLTGKTFENTFGDVRSIDIKPYEAMKNSDKELWSQNKTLHQQNEK